MKARVLIAEDDPNIRLGLLATLESEGYHVVAASDGAQALRLAPNEKPHLVILDIMMPRMNGYDVCRELRRADPRLPILFLSAKGEEIDKVVGLKLGADDYLVKPFGVRELLARVEALLRRTRALATPAETPAPAGERPACFDLGSARIDRRTLTATVNGRTAELTARELKLAEFLAAHAGEVLSRDALLNAVWGADYFGTTRTLDQHILQLRKKIEIDPNEPRTIVTAHGIGYRCVPGRT